MPRGTEYTGTAPGPAAPASAGRPNMAWSAANQSVATTLVADGMNEKGLVVGMLLFPGYAEYPAADAAKKRSHAGQLGSCHLSAFDLCHVGRSPHGPDRWQLLISNAEFTPFGQILPVHYYIADASGEVLIAEFVGGELQLHDDPFGILTNSPDFVWQQTNLLNFVNLSPVNVPNSEIEGRQIEGFGQGTGALGLPGDLRPPSRFVRAGSLLALGHARRDRLGNGAGRFSCAQHVRYFRRRHPPQHRPPCPPAAKPFSTRRNPKS